MIKNNFFQNKKTFIYFFIVIILGLTLRIYNINFDDLWSDEMASFWISDPIISFDETLQRIFSSNWVVLYEILLKYFHYFFGYDVHVSRYFSFLISVFSLIFFGFLLFKITDTKSAILGLFLLAINIYHIKYSIELRSYILTFFLVTIFIYFAFKNKAPDFNMGFLKLLFFNLISILMLLCHAYTLLVIGSYILFIFFKIYFHKIKFNRENILLISSLLLTMSIFLLFYFHNSLKILDPNNVKLTSLDWIAQVRPSFYTNFYFSNFFGSRLLGLIYLVILLYLIFKFRHQLIKEFDVYNFFIILIFFTYFLPLVFGYLFKPVLVNRYIFFVLIPIISLLCHFIFLVKLSSIRNLLIIIICIPSFLNLLIVENTGRQFYSTIYPTKPEIRKALQFIDNSITKNFTFNRDDRYAVNTNAIYQNYLLKYLDNLDIHLNYLGYDDNLYEPSKLWVIYIRDTAKEEFKITKRFSNYRITEHKFLNNLNLYLLSK